MAGYTRQSIADIINGSEITAPPLNSEFNQVSAAFNATSGHIHDGSTGNAPKINLATSVSGYLPAANGGIGGKNNFVATTTPVATNDSGDGYAPGSMWENTTTGRIYICVGNTSNAAVWRELVQVTTGNAILPAATDTVDLGNNGTRFQDLFLSGGISAATNVAVGGTLNITGATALGSTLGVTGDATFVNLAATGTTVITSVDLNSGAIDSTAIGTTTPAAGTFTTLNANTSLVAATADINGGSVDGATIGASTPSTGAFTTLGASGTATLATVDINAGAIDGTTIGASNHSTGKFTTLNATTSLVAATADINGGTIDGSAIGASVPSSGAFTTVAASGAITGNLTGNVTGNTAGVHTGAVAGNVTGNITGNVTSAGSSSFNNVTIDGTLNMNAGTSATITNLSAPVNDNDAARKVDVDNAVSGLVDSAPGALDTLNELAAALGDDADFSTTITNSIATKLPLAGGTVTGAIAMSTNKITGVGNPTAAQDVATKVYTDTQRDTRLATAGGTMSGEVAMGNNKITGLATPTANTDASSKGYVDGVLGSATVASTSATTATTQAGIATTKAGEAAGSATAAAGSATTASTALSTFQNQYLGAQGSAPTADPDGSALDVGDLYFDTVAGAMKVYSANGWTNAGSSVNGTTNRYSYTATAGQTVFAATFDSGYVDVFLNGVKQLVGTDVTATSGTSVVFASGTTVNDIVEIVGYGTFVLADHYTEAQSDARYVEVAGDTMSGNLNVGGTVTADGLIVNDASNANIDMVREGSSVPSAEINFKSDLSGVPYYGGRIKHYDGNTTIYTQNNTTTEQDYKRLNIAATGDISFYDDSNNAKFFWDASAESLSIGATVNSQVPLNVSSATVGTGNAIAFLRNSSATGNGVVVDVTNTPSDYIADFRIGNASKMRIDSSGNLLVGTASTIASADFTVNSAGNTRMNLASDGVERFGVFADSGIAALYAGGTSVMTLSTNATERMRIDASGNLLVGKTVSDFNTQGFEINSGGQLRNSRASGAVAFLNRKTDDGSIVDFGKDGTVVGSIGNISSNLYVGNADTGLGFSASSNTLYPISVAAGAIRDAGIDLGISAARFKDLYLSGGVYLGGTGAANKLDDYEEGTFTPSVINISGTPLSGFTYTIQSGSYTKVGNTVHLRVVVATSGTPSGTDVLYINLPFAVSNAGSYAYATAAPLVREVTFADNQYIVLETTKGTSRAAALKVTSGGTTPAVLMNDLGSAFNLNVAISYQTDA